MEIVKYFACNILFVICWAPVRLSPLALANRDPNKSNQIIATVSVPHLASESLTSGVGVSRYARHSDRGSVNL